MAFLRFVGCSVGKKTCTHCDTDFDKTYPELGGGMFDENELIEWIGPDIQRVCSTGGEPLNRDLGLLITKLTFMGKIVHIETSGTVDPDSLRRTSFGIWNVFNPLSGDPQPCKVYLTLSP